MPQLQKLHHVGGRYEQSPLNTLSGGGDGENPFFKERREIEERGWEKEDRDREKKADLVHAVEGCRRL